MKINCSPESNNKANSKGEKKLKSHFPNQKEMGELGKYFQIEFKVEWIL